jgi:hypothetical protein
MNLYEYAVGQPMVMTDPSGLVRVSACAAAARVTSNGYPKEIATDISGSDIRIRCVQIPNVQASHCYAEQGPYREVKDRDGIPIWSGHPTNRTNPLDWGPIKTNHKPFGESWDKDLYRPVEDFDSFNEFTTPVDCSGGADTSGFAECMNKAMDAINDCKINYDLLGPNSNSTLHGALDACMPEGCKLSSNPPRSTSLLGPVGWGSPGVDKIRACLCKTFPKLCVAEH